MPWLLTHCPVYEAAPSVAHAQPMPPDCPMMGQMQAMNGMPGTQQETPTPSDDRSNRRHGAPSCPLCEVSSAAHGYVVAGLIALPPLPIPVATGFTSQFSKFSLRYSAAAFSARAPPPTV